MSAGAVVMHRGLLDLSGQSGRVVAICCFIALLGGCALEGGAEFSRYLSEPAEGESAAEAVPQQGDIILIGGNTATNVDFDVGTELPALKSAEIFRPNAGTFALTGSLAVKRAGIQAVGFASGPLAHRILVPGGASGSAHFNATNGVVTLSGFAQKSAELFNATTGVFQPTDAMAAARDLATVTRLEDGTVLVAGGFNGTTPRNGAEIYDPSTQMFSPTTNTMRSPRALHTATLLANGQVLIAGGVNNADGTVSNTAELYNPATKRFALIADPLPSMMAAHTATRIAGCNCANNGKVLLAGGFTSIDLGPDSIETAGKQTTLYDPATKQFTAGPMLTDARNFHTATLLPGGRVLLAGGAAGQTQFGGGNITGFSGGQTRDTAEIYSSKTGALACINAATGGACNKSMVLGRMMHSATVIPAGTRKGQVLLAGGSLNRAAELFNPANDTFAAAGVMKTRRAFHAALAVP
jgi:hypothetical protein